MRRARHASIQWIPFSVVTLLPSFALAHGQSKSAAECVLDGARAEVRVAIAEHDLREGLEALDPARAGRLSAADLDVIRAHVRDGTKLSLGDGRACAVERVDVAPSGEPVVEVVATVTLECPDAPGEYVLALGYLPRLVPPHVTLAVITAGEARASHTFSPVAPRFVGRVPRPSAPRAALIVGAVAIALVAAWAWRRRGAPGM
ncbi:hypothetical protein L6R52_02900 [Myxococcota bacterium]|nr:hypothetical protein [Myxococcota bacterium]